MASNLDNADAMVKYGDGLKDKYFEKISPYQASVYYKKAADLGNTKGMIKYGDMLSKSVFKGEDLHFQSKEQVFSIRNNSFAMKYFKKAANLGSSQGMCNYGYGLSLGYNGKKIFLVQ